MRFNKELLLVTLTALLSTSGLMASPYTLDYLIEASVQHAREVFDNYFGKEIHMKITEPSLAHIDLFVEIVDDGESRVERVANKR